MRIYSAVYTNVHERSQWLSVDERIACIVYAPGRAATGNMLRENYPHTKDTSGRWEVNCLGYAEKELARVVELVSVKGQFEN